MQLKRRKEDTSPTIKPFFRWAGSKFGQTEIYEFIKELYTPHNLNRIWIEPFCGALGLTLRVKPQTAMLCDSNLMLHNFYKWMQTEAAKTYNWDILTRAHTEEFYYSVRDIFNNKSNHILFWYLNQAGYNGVVRYNSSGQYNVPVGRKANGSLKDIAAPENIEYFQDLSKHWMFHHMDYKETLLIADQLQDNAFVVCDPPYDRVNGESSIYSTDNFSWLSQKLLAVQCSKLNCPVIICNAATDRITELYTRLGFTIHRIEANRNIGRNNSTQSSASEIIAYRGF